MPDQSPSEALHSKFPWLGTTVFSIISQEALEYGAVNLGQGFPDFPCSEKLMDLVNNYMRRGYNQYAPMPGVPELREQIAEKTERSYGVNVDPDKEITITTGATEALNAVMAAMIRPGDEVICFEPVYDSYVPLTRFNGGEPVRISMDEDTFRIDWEKVRGAVNEKTRMIVVNTPHNPTGTVLKKEDWHALEDIIKGKDIFVLSDEVYEHLTFDNREHESVLKFPALRSKSIAVYSFGKTFHTTGWRLGYCIAPEEITKEIRKVHQYVTYASPTPVQYAMADFLKDPEHYERLPEFYQERRDFFRGLMRDSRFEFLPSEGTYFQLATYDKISHKNDYDFVMRLIKEFGVAAIHLSAFTQSGLQKNVIRFCFAKKDETLEKAAEKLCRI